MSLSSLFKMSSSSILGCLLLILYGCLLFILYMVWWPSSQKVVLCCWLGCWKRHWNNYQNVEKFGFSRVPVASRRVNLKCLIQYNEHCSTIKVGTVNIILDFKDLFSFEYDGRNYHLLKSIVLKTDILYFKTLPYICL